jgi:hydrogenase-4 component F
LTNLLFPLLLGLPVAGAALCAAFHGRRMLELVTVASTGGTFLSALWLLDVLRTHATLSSPQGWWYADGLSGYIAAIVAGSTLVVTFSSIGYLRRQHQEGAITDRQRWVYFLLLNTFLFTMMLVLVSDNLGFLWIGAEATTLATAFLVAFYERESSIEAAWKYVIICSVGIALALFGIILTYFSALHVVSGSQSPLHWSTLIRVAKDLDPAVLKLAFVFVLIGFGTKAGLAPMHTWKPDAYAEAPAPISALMAAGLVNVALYAIMRFTLLVNKGVGGEFASTLLVIFGIVSVGLAVPFVLLQRDFKRLLAYSSVEHVGIIVFALGIGSPLGYFGAMLHLLNNALAKMLLFLTAGNVRLAYKSKIMHKVTGAIKLIPASATFLIVGTFALTGWPPFGLFMSELTILNAGFTGGFAIPSVICILCIAAIFAGFIYYTSRMVFGTPQGPVKGGEAGVGTLVLLGLLLAALLLLGVALPLPVEEAIRNAVKVLNG